MFFFLLYDKTFGFLLFPLLVLGYFFLFNVSYYIVLSSLALFVIILIFKLFWFWRIGSANFGLSPFYIFYYCISMGAGGATPIVLLFYQ